MGVYWFRDLMNGTTSHAAESFAFRLPASAESLGRLSAIWREIVESLQLTKVESQWLFEVELCFVEVVTNAIKYGAGTMPDPKVELRASVTERMIELVVTDHGPGMGSFEASGEIPEDPMAESGRGLAIVRALIPDVRYEPRAEGNRLILRRPLPPDPPGT